MCEVIARTWSWCSASILAIMLPARRHSSATRSIAASSVPGGGVIRNQRPSNSVSKPASGPVFSVPAIGWPGTKWTPSGKCGVTESSAAPLTEPTSETMAPGDRLGAMARATSP